MTDTLTLESMVFGNDPTPQPQMAYAPAAQIRTHAHEEGKPCGCHAKKMRADIMELLQFIVMGLLIIFLLKVIFR